MQTNRQILQITKGVLSGFILGCGALIPGLSIGTLAVVLGIYKRLFFLLGRVIASYKYTAADKRFMRCIGLGIFLAVFILPGPAVYLLKYYTVAVYSLFTGLVLASLPSIFFKSEKRHRLWGVPVACFMLGVSFLWPEGRELADPAHGMIFLSGFLGCFFAALPGLSGSMVLLWLGTYSALLTALQHGVWGVLLVFVAGGILGFIAVFWSLKILFVKYYSFLYALIFWIVAGSLPGIFPWREWNAENSVSFFGTAFCFMAIGVIIFFGFKTLKLAHSIKL